MPHAEQPGGDDRERTNRDEPGPTSRTTTTHQQPPIPPRQSPLEIEPSGKGSLRSDPWVNPDRPDLAWTSQPSVTLGSRAGSAGSDTSIP